MLNRPTSCARPGSPCGKIIDGSSVVAGGGWLPANGPIGIVVHHTASSPASNGQRDVDYMTFDCDVLPMAKLYLDRPTYNTEPAATYTSTVEVWSPGYPSDTYSPDAGVYERP